nr:unnamed protein product [Digitaria exilis]
MPSSRGREPAKPRGPAVARAVSSAWYAVARAGVSGGRCRGRCRSHSGATRGGGGGGCACRGGSGGCCSAWRGGGAWRGATGCWRGGGGCCCSWRRGGGGCAPPAPAAAAAAARAAATAAAGSASADRDEEATGNTPTAAPTPAAGSAAALAAAAAGEAPSPTAAERQEYFTNYIVNESLGIIASAHVVFADKEHLKAESAPCIELAKLFSVAVDFPKTGVPALIPPELHVKEYPDFMEKLDKVTYESTGVIGKLYREIKKHTPHIKHFTRDEARRSYDTDLIVDGYKDYISEAIDFKEDYDFKLGNLMDHYGIKSEAEIISGCILKMAKNFTKSSDADAIRMAVRSLRKEARLWFNEMSTGEDGIGQDATEAKASAWYHVTYHPQYWGSYNEGYDRPHLISFPWCVYDKLLCIKQRTNFLRTMEPDLASLMSNMNQNLRFH